MLISSEGFELIDHSSVQYSFFLEFQPRNANYLQGSIFFLTLKVASLSFFLNQAFHLKLEHKYEVYGILSVVMLTGSILFTPKVEAFNSGDIIITCGTDYNITCFKYEDETQSHEWKGGIRDIVIE